MQYGFTAIGVIAWGYSATVWTSARIYQEHNSHLFDQELKLKNRAAIPRVAAVPEAGGLVGRLEIPRIGVSVMVVEGAERHDLERAVGHVPGTARASFSYARDWTEWKPADGIAHDGCSG